MSMVSKRRVESEEHGSKRRRVRNTKSMDDQGSDRGLGGGVSGRRRSAEMVAKESFSAKVYHHPEDKAFHSNFEGVKMGIMEGSKRKTHRI